MNNENSKSRMRSEDLRVKSQHFVTDSVVDLITMDVSRTFPSLGIFQKVVHVYIVTEKDVEGSLMKAGGGGEFKIVFHHKVLPRLGSIEIGQFIQTISTLYSLVVIHSVFS